MFVIKKSGVQQAGARCLSVRKILPLLLLLLFPCGQHVFAESKELEKHGHPFRFPLTALALENTERQKNPPWIVEIKKDSEWIPHYIEDISSNRFCMSIRFYNPEAAFVHIGDGRYQPGVNDGKSVNCWNRESHSQLPAFQVIVDVSPALESSLLLENQAYATRILVDVDVAETQTEVAQYKWSLQARRQDGQWHTIGGLNIDGFSQSRWIQDPIDKNHYALLLVGEAPGGAGAHSPATRSAPSVLSLRGLQSRALNTIRIKSAAPVINFKKNQTVNKLLLEVLPVLSNPSQGWYCIRPIYKEEENYLSFTNLNDQWVTSSSVIPGEHNTVSCEDTENLIFPVYLQLNPADITQEIARLYISQRSKSSTFDLDSNSTITLKSGESTSGAVLARYSESPSDSVSGWTSIRGKPALVLSGQQSKSKQASAGTNSSGAAVTLKYGGNGEPPDDVLLFDGASWKSWDDPRILVNRTKVQWDSSKAHPLNIQLCIDTECDGDNLIARIDNSSNPFELSVDQFDGVGKAYVIIDWGPPIAGDGSSQNQNSGALLSGDGDAQSSSTGITFAPVVKYGQYSRPLTACLGRVISKTQSGPLFSLKLGKQVMEPGGWPADLGSDDMVRVVFDQARGGGTCPVQGLESQQYVVSSLLRLADSGTVDIELDVQEPVFVGYFQLNGADYRSTLVRWREVIELLSRTYKQGRANGSWVDGLVFSAGEKGGVYPTIEPDSNFVSTLSDDASLLDIAQSLESNTRVSSDLFAEQLLSLKEILGETPVSLMYFDDFLSDCGNYNNDLVSSGLNIKEAIVIAAIAGYTGKDDSMRSIGGGLAHVCEESKNANVTVYAFNWKEQLGNLAWEKTFNTIYEDLLQRWK